MGSQRDRRPPGIITAASIDVFLTGEDAEGFLLSSGIGDMDGE